MPRSAKNAAALMPPPSALASGIWLHVAGRGDDIVLAHQLQNFVAAERDGLLSDQQHVTRDRPIGVLADNGVDDIAAECHCLLQIAPNGRLGRQTDRLSATSPTQSAFRASTPDCAAVLHRGEYGEIGPRRRMPRRSGRGHGRKRQPGSPPAGAPCAG